MSGQHHDSIIENTATDNIYLRKTVLNSEAVFADSVKEGGSDAYSKDQTTSGDSPMTEEDVVGLVGDVPDIRLEKVQNVKHRIQNGEYHIDDKKIDGIAEAMLDPDRQFGLSL